MLSVFASANQRSTTTITVNSESKKQLKPIYVQFNIAHIRNGK